MFDKLQRNTYKSQYSARVDGTKRVGQLILVGLDALSPFVALVHSCVCHVCYVATYALKVIFCPRVVCICFVSDH